MTLDVSEIFTSIQGESTRAGCPCTFVRLSGCNLRCGYCDTRYAQKEGTPRTVEEIVQTVEEAGVPLVEVTGGEPLEQAGVHELMARLLEKGHSLMIETNGSRPIGTVDPRVMIVLDVKSPGSGEAASFLPENLGHLKPEDNVKFVLTSEADYLWARDFIQRHAVASTCPVLFSAVPGGLTHAELAAWILRDRLPVRLNVQLHKWIWGPDARGV